MKTLFGRMHMPAFAGATGWLNSEPLVRTGERGHMHTFEQGHL